MQIVKYMASKFPSLHLYEKKTIYHRYLYFLHNQLNDNDDEEIKIGWNYRICNSITGLLGMYNNPVFIQDTSYNITDLLSWDTAPCGSQTIGRITIIGVPDNIHRFEITIGPFHKLTPNPFETFFFQIVCIVPFKNTTTVVAHIYRTDDYNYFQTISPASPDGTPSSVSCIVKN
jgi:hypothetical protein